MKGGERKIEGIIIDCDGTIIGASQEMRPRVREALLKARSRVKISFCTGRPYKWVVAIAQEFGLDTLHVAEGGARVVSSEGGVKWEKLIPADAVQIILAMAQKDDFSVGAQVSGEDDLEWKSPSRVEPMSHLFLWAYERERVERLIGEMRNRVPHVHVVLSQFKFKNEPLRWLADITAAGANKQHALLHLAELEGLDLKNFMGIGDGYNDYPFLLACGYKVAMGNAPKELKDIADYVAPSIEEDGVAEAIERFIL